MREVRFDKIETLRTMFYIQVPDDIPDEDAISWAEEYMYDEEYERTVWESEEEIVNVEFSDPMLIGSEE